VIALYGTFLIIGLNLFKKDYINSLRQIWLLFACGGIWLAAILENGVFRLSFRRVVRDDNTLPPSLNYKYYLGYTLST
jgi:hypothetical protein